MLIYNGLKPIFLDPYNIDECNVKRKELLQLLPVEECLKYFDMENEIKKPMIFEIENLIDCYNANSRYIIGYNVARILDDETLVEDKQKYINEINKLNQTKVFENPDNLKECISFLKNKMKLVLR